MPKFFKGILFDKIDTGKTGKINKQAFSHFWRREFQNLDVTKRIFKTLAKSENTDHLNSDDFKPLMRSLLDSHPGLEFL